MLNEQSVDNSKANGLVEAETIFISLILERQRRKKKWIPQSNGKTNKKGRTNSLCLTMSLLDQPQKRRVEEMRQEEVISVPCNVSSCIIVSWKTMFKTTTSSSDTRIVRHRMYHTQKNKNLKNHQKHRHLWQEDWFVRHKQGMKEEER